MRKLLISLVLAFQLSALPSNTYVFPNDPVDVVIPCAPIDKKILEICIQSIRDYVQNLRRIIVISKERITDAAEWYDEKDYPFSKESIALEIFNQDEGEARAFLDNPSTRIGWIYQQFLKLYAPFVIPGISRNVLIVDADVIWLRPVRFMTADNEPMFTLAHEHHTPYFDHMSRLIEGLGRVSPITSGVAHHMLFQTPILEDLFQVIADAHGVEAWKAICRCIDLDLVYGSSFSEYEIYFNFALLRSDNCLLNPLKWTNIHSLDELPLYKKKGYAYVAYHHYNRRE